MRNRLFTTLCLLAFLPILLFSSCRKHRKGKGEIKSVLIFGNSIVQHGPAPQIGWNGNWGMAASTQDSDFVHLLISEIKAKDSTVRFDYANIGSFEFNPDYDYHRLDTFVTPDMLILRFSENVIDSTAGNGALLKRYDQLIQKIDPENTAVKVIVTGIWYRPNTHRLLKKYAAEHHYIFINNDDFLNDPTHTAKGLFQDTGVAAHPSDKGMRLIKDRIWEGIKQYF